MTMFYNVRQSVNQFLERSGKEIELSKEGKEKKVQIQNIEEYAIGFIKTNQNDDYIITRCNELNNNDITATEKDNIKYILGDRFKGYNSNLGNPLSYYFRYLYNLINFVMDYWQEDLGQIHKYLNFVQAQMSDAELCLLFYNCISRDAKDSKYNYTFFSKINDLNFLQNISQEWLISKSNHVIYDKTKFRFLDRSALDKKLTV